MSTNQLLDLFRHMRDKFAKRAQYQHTRWCKLFRLKPDHVYRHKLRWAEDMGRLNWTLAIKCIDIIITLYER
jgi:hypothetical protein